MTKAIFNIEQEEITFGGKMEKPWEMYNFLGVQMLQEGTLEEERKRYRKETERLGAEQYYKNIAVAPLKISKALLREIREEEDIQSVMGGFEWMKEIDILAVPPNAYRKLVNPYGLKASIKPLTPHERRLDIKLKSTHLEDQKNRLVKELGLDQAEAQIISDMVRRLAEVKIKEAGKQWSESVKRAFTNLMTAILIEETKAIRSKPQQIKRAMIGTNYKDRALCQV